MNKHILKVGQRVLIATGYKNLNGDFVIRKRFDFITKIMRQGFEVGKLKFDFNGHQKQRQQVTGREMLSVAMAVTYNDYLIMTAEAHRKYETSKKRKQLEHVGDLVHKLVLNSKKITDEDKKSKDYKISKKISNAILSNFKTK